MFHVLPFSAPVLRRKGAPKWAIQAVMGQEVFILLIKLRQATQIAPIQRSPMPFVSAGNKEKKTKLAVFFLIH